VNKDEIIEDFFRSLRVALTNAFSYPKDHPYFIKSVESFKVKLDTLLAALNPFRIGITSSGLVVEGKTLNRAGFYDELARLLHQRKIKSIEILAGFELNELLRFLCVVSLSQKEIFKSGGLGVILEKEKLTHFKIQELDYSAFLHGEGQECTDIWGYMLKDAVYSGDAVKMDQLADSFGSLIKKVNDKEFFEEEGVSSEVSDFLVSLRNKNKEKFDKCLNDVFIWLLRNKKTLSQDKLDKLKPVFNNLDENEFTKLLKEGFLQEDNFDSLSLQLFSRISEQKETARITEDFFNNMDQSPELKDNPVVVKKIRNLLSNSHDDQMSAVYRNTLDSLVRNISFSGKLFFDHQELKENYRYIVLSVLATDLNPETVQQASAILERGLPEIFEDNDIPFLKDFWEVLTKKEGEGLGACGEIKKKISSYAEDIILGPGLASGQELLAGMVIYPEKGSGVYLDKIFSPGRADSHVLDLFLRLFPGDLGIFYSRVEQSLQDTEFLAGLIDALSESENEAVPEILKYIYSRANELVKIESLKVMSKFKKIDADFLFRQLNTDSFPLRKELVSVLILDERIKKNIPGILFKIPGFFGSANPLLMENMQIAFDLHFVESAGLIKELSRRRFFWNAQLRKKAARVLKGWNLD